MQETIRCRFFQRAFGWCVPIGALGGLIGLGGGEFRLPVLMYAIGFDAKGAVPLNLMVSLVTLAFSLIVRSRAVSLSAILPFLPEVIGLATGGILSAAYGARLVKRLTSRHLAQIIGALLAGIGVLMLVEVAHPLCRSAARRGLAAGCCRLRHRHWHRPYQQPLRRRGRRAADPDAHVRLWSRY